MQIFLLLEMIDCMHVNMGDNTFPIALFYEPSFLNLLDSARYK